MYKNKPKERDACIRKVQKYAGALNSNPSVTAVIV